MAVSVPKCVGEKRRWRIDKRGLSDDPGIDKKNRRGHRAREHYRARSRISAILERDSRARGVGMEAVSALWEPGDGEVGALRATSVVFGGAALCASTAAQMPWVWGDILGAFSVVGAGKLVCSGGASVCDRSLAAWQDILAAHGRVCAVVDG